MQRKGFRPWRRSSSSSSAWHLPGIYRPTTYIPQSAAVRPIRSSFRTPHLAPGSPPSPHAATSANWGLHDAITHPIGLARLQSINHIIIRGGDIIFRGGSQGLLEANTLYHAGKGQRKGGEIIAICIKRCVSLCVCRIVFIYIFAPYYINSCFTITVSPTDPPTLSGFCARVVIE